MLIIVKLTFEKKKIDKLKQISRKCDKCGFNFFIEQNLKHQPDLFSCNEYFEFLLKFLLFRIFTHHFFVQKIGEEYYRVWRNE